MEFLYTNLRRRLLCLSQDARHENTPADSSARIDTADRVSEQLTILSTARLASCSVQAEVDACEARGVLVEFGVDAGVDAFSAYSDGWIGWFDSARKTYIEGKAASAAVAGVVELMIAAAAIVENRLAVVDGESPPPLAGECTISVITSSGIYFGTGTSRAMATDHLGAPIIRVALGLRVALLQGR